MPIPPTGTFKDQWVRHLELPTKDKPQISYFEKRDRGRSLCLNVSYQGTKCWRAMFYDNGKPKSRAIGYFYPNKPSLTEEWDVNRDGALRERHMSVAVARRAVLAFDPKPVLSEARSGTFEATAEDRFAEYVERKGLRTAKEMRRHFDVYVLPEWRTAKTAAIEPSTVKKLLRNIEEKHSVSVAEAIFTTLSSLFSWYEKTNDDKRYLSPMKKVMRPDLRSMKEKERDRVFNDAEIRVFWQATGEMPTVFGCIARFLLLTGQRLSKVQHMRWDHVDGNIWTIETENLEKGNAGVLVLPPLAMEVLAEAKKFGDGDGYVFPGVNGSFFNNMSGGKQLLDKMMDGEMLDILPCVLHDLRRTARTLLERAGIELYICERILGHTLQGVLRIYNRHPYRDEKARALQTLENMIRSIVDPSPASNVVHLERSSLKAEAV